MFGATAAMWKRAVLSTVVCSLLGAAAPAVVVSDDPNNHEVTPPSDFDMVGAVAHGSDRGATATLIDSWHILSAKHVLNGSWNDTLYLDLADGTHAFTITERFVHPNVDIAVARLDRSTGLPGHALYTLTSEKGKEGVVVGYGVSGTGMTGENPWLYPRGTNRYGYNRIDVVLTQADTNYLVMDFDHPSIPGPTGPGSLGSDREVIYASGDSGGPTFIDVGGELKIAGIHVYMSDFNDNGLVPDFGDICYDLRISPLADWIQSQIGEYKDLALTVVTPDDGVVEIDPEPTDSNQPEFPAGVVVTLIAEPEWGHDFLQWEIYDPNHPGDANYMSVDANDTLIIVMDTDHEVIARFECGSGMAPVLVIGFFAACTTITCRSTFPRR